MDIAVSFHSKRFSILPDPHIHFKSIGKSHEFVLYYYVRLFLCMCMYVCVCVCICKCTDTNDWTSNVPCVTLIEIGTHCSKRAQNYTAKYTKHFSKLFCFLETKFFFFCILAVVKTEWFSSPCSLLLLYHVSQNTILVGCYSVCFYRISGHLWMFSFFSLRIEANHAK